MLLLLCTTAANAVEPAEERVHERYPDQVAALFAAAAESTLAYDRLRVLCDEIGHRISGSPQLEAAIDWAAGEMAADGLVVRTEEVMVPRWVRGEESVTLLQPVNRELAMLGLGMSVGGDVTAEVVAVESFEELAALPDEAIAGKIVLFDAPFVTYGQTVGVRGGAAVHAARRGAVGALIRSVGSASLNTPHTGAMYYEEGVPQIPAAALSHEHAAWLHRLADSGQTVEVRLKMAAEHQGMVPSRNLIAELPGRELPEEVVVVSCHYDSWDVGQGAQDDGAGCMMAWDALRLIQALDMVPRRTLRAVLYTNEENGLGGGKAYAEAHADELALHQAMIESDIGNGIADGFRVDLRGLDEPQRLRAQGLLWELGQALSPFSEMVPGYSGADIGPSVAQGVPGLGVGHDSSLYFHIHHTEADTFDKIVLEDLQHNAGLIAAAAWVLAEMPERLVEPTKTRRRR